MGFAFSNRNSLLLTPYSVHSLSVWTPKGHECFSENEFFKALLFLAIPLTNLTLFSSSPFKWEMFVTMLSVSKGAWFSAAHGTFPKADHILKHNTSLNRYEKIWNTILCPARPLWITAISTTTGSLQIHGNWITCYWMKSRSRQKSKRKLKTF